MSFKSFHSTTLTESKSGPFTHSNASTSDWEFLSIEKSLKNPPTSSPPNNTLRIKLMNLDELKKIIETGSFHSVKNWILLDYIAQSTALVSPGKYFRVVPNNLQKPVPRWDI